MRSRTRDVDDFLKGVKELDERTHKEDEERLERMKSSSEGALQDEQDRFARMRARENYLRQQRDQRTQELQPKELSVEQKRPPALPSRPSTTQEQQPASPKQPKPAIKGFVASALRHASPEASPEPQDHSGNGLNGTHKPEAPKPSWISSAMTKSKPQLTERKPVGSGPSLSRSRSTSPTRPLRPQNAGFDARYDTKSGYRDEISQPPKEASPSKSPTMEAPKKVSPARKPVMNVPVSSQRTPSQSLKEARSSLAKKPKPKMEDPIKEFREQLVLSPTSSPKKKVREQQSPAVEQPARKQPAPKLPPRREPSIPEALRNRSLKPALPVRKTTPPKMEAHEKMKTLRPAQNSPRPEEETPEALERMKSLSKPPKIERQAEPEPDALKTLRSLRPSKSVEKKPPPSPEALDKLHNLRKAKPKPEIEPVVPEAWKKRESLKSSKPAPKPSLQRSPNTNLRQTSSTVDFRETLSSALAKGPSASEEDDSSPLRRAQTDPREQQQQQPLEHLTKSRTRGPKRKLPSLDQPKTSHNAKQLPKELQIPKRTTVKPGKDASDRKFSREELKRIASAKQKPKLST